MVNDNHERFKKILAEAEILRYKKYKLYGDCYKDFGLLGIMIKINDKCSRIKNIMQNNVQTDQMNNESLRDSAIDLLNYCTMYIMTIDEEFIELQKNVNKK